MRTQVLKEGWRWNGRPRGEVEVAGQLSVINPFPGAWPRASVRAVEPQHQGGLLPALGETRQ